MEDENLCNSPLAKVFSLPFLCLANSVRLLAGEEYFMHPAMILGSSVFSFI
jgi:hypothetical protein